MRLLITDVTDMSPGNFCVAGWDIQNNVMVRPLPNGSNWTSALLGQYDVRPGILMDFAPAGRQHNGTYPHSTEDTVVNLTQIAVADRSAHDWLNTTSAARAETVQEAFDGNVQYNRVYRGQRQGIYVAQGTNCRSLWGLEIDRDGIEFISDSFQGDPARLKAVVNDGEGEYVLSVSSHELKAAFQHGDHDDVAALILGGGRLHVRLGLARAFPDTPDRCTLMVNGVYG